MRITDKDIIKAAQDLRDQQNSRLTVRPWRRHSHFQIPTWLVAVPAAAITGFAIGIWIGATPQVESPIVAQTDTVYINTYVPTDTSRMVDKAVSEAEENLGSKQGKILASPKGNTPIAKRPRIANEEYIYDNGETSGMAASADRIRYDLLVRN